MKKAIILILLVSAFACARSQTYENIARKFETVIKLSEPDIDRVRIKPQMSDLSSSTIKVPTTKGPIHAEYQQMNNSHLYIIDLPVGMK